MKKQSNASAMSLSVYNRPVSLSRPKTASVNVYQGVKGLRPQEVGEDGQPIEQPAEDSARIPDMKP